MSLQSRSDLPRKVPRTTGTRRGERRFPSAELRDRFARGVGNGVFLLLAVATIGLLASVAGCAASTSRAPAPGARSGTASATAPTDGGDDWIALRSQAPADILAAARSGQLFQESPAGGGDGAPDLSRLGTPVFVQALRPAGVTTDQVPDFYVVPVLNEAGATTDAVELELNPARSAVREIAIVTYSSPRASGSIAQLGEDQAVQMVASQRHITVQANIHPYLVYFALDPQAQFSQNASWTGGGALPADPIWLVPATDGQAYLAGNDGNVYTVAQLPQQSGGGSDTPTP